MLLLAVQLIFTGPQASAESADGKASSMTVQVASDMHHDGQPCEKRDGAGLQHCFMTLGCFAPAIVGQSVLLLADGVAREHWPAFLAAYLSQAVDPLPRPPRTSAFS
jgi:hypothetical protein